ncbi:MAG: efflux RND transporter permease subunit [Planctomycetota bacterium]|nr:MAG: efflux RND transporter permease subunit [Planctomycetota bacterium]
MALEPDAGRTRRDSVIGRLVARPVAMTMLVLSVAVFGIVSFFKLRVDLLPEISYPTLTVRTSWPGSAPEDVEQRISMRVQEALATLPHLVRSSSNSRAGASDVVLEFEWGTEMTFAVQDVREKLDGVFMPRGAERPLILRYDPNLDPILRIGVAVPKGATSADDLARLRWLTEKRIERELETVPGVAAVQVRGGIQEEIRISADPFKLAAHGLDPEAVALRLAQENINASGGSLREGSAEYLVRTLNEFGSVEEIADLAIVRRGDAAVRVRDVAHVERTGAKRTVISRIDGDEAVEISVYREAGANIVQVADRVKSRLFGTPEQRQWTATLVAEGREKESETIEGRARADYLEWKHRKDARFELLSDQSTFIRAAIDEVRSSALTGAILSILVLWLFLRRVAPTLIIGLAIPISVVATFAPMFLGDVTLNLMSLGGLALGVGMMVDGAIVVLESIERCRDDGDSPFDAAVRGTQEVAGAVTSTVVTTIAVFAPILFVTGVAGQMFGDQSLAVVASLTVSLFVALFFIPVLCALPGLSGAAQRGATGASERLAPATGFWARVRRVFGIAFGYPLRALVIAFGAILKFLGWLTRPISGAFAWSWGYVERFYRGLLRFAVAAPLVVIAASILAGWLAWMRLPAVGSELIPDIHQGEFTAHVQLEESTPLDRTDAILSGLDARVRTLPEVRATALVSGIEPDTLSRDPEGPHTGRLTVRMVDGVESEREDVFAEEVRALLREHPAVVAVEIRRPTPFALEAPIAVEVRGRDLDEIGRIANEVRDRLTRIPELSDVRTSARPGHPEARITFDRDKTLEYRLDLSKVTNLVRDQVLGNVGTRFNEGEDRIDVRVQGDLDVLSSLDSVLDLVVNPGAANPVPLRAVADVRRVQGPAEIRRLGNTRAVVVTAAGRGLDLGGLSQRIQREIADIETPADVLVELGGQKREMEEGLQSMQFALWLAIFLVYITMAVQFESVLQPLVIMVTVPLSAIGVVLALDLFEVKLSVIVLLGVVILAGVVVDNAIVLLDRVNQQRGRGMSVRDALLEAGSTRLRPIMMTTATTVLGLLPMSGWLPSIPGLGAGSSQGAELQRPLAITMIAGMILGTLLTLMVIPALYDMLFGALERRKLRRGGA